MPETLAKWIITTITARTLKASALGTSIVALTVSPILSQQKPVLTFPYFVDGDGWRVQLTLHSFGNDATVNIATVTYGEDAETVRFPGFNQAGEQVPDHGTRVWTTLGQGSLRQGAILVYLVSTHDTVPLIDGTLTYINPTTGVETAVPGQPSSYQRHYLFAQEDPTVGTGIAVVKTIETTVCLWARGEDGDLVGSRDQEICYGPGQNNFSGAARTLSEWTEGLFSPVNFKGTLWLTSLTDSATPSDQDGFHVVGLRYGKVDPFLYTVPVVSWNPEEEGSEEPPSTGLNTSLADPDGQWRATAQAKIIEKNDTYWEFSYFVDMTNRTNEEQEYTVKVHFLDGDGFSVDEGFAGDAINKIPAQSTQRLLGRALINPETAVTVVDLQLEVRVW